MLKTIHQQDSLEAANNVAHNVSTLHSTNIEQLLRESPDLWRGRDMNQADIAQDQYGFRGQSTGFPELDTVLPGRGWPRNALTEIISPYWGMGELQLLLPLMRSITEQGKWILWIAPPYLVYAPALAKAGVDTEQVLAVQATTSCRDALWTIEKALQTESCGLVLAWQNWLSNKVIRRLQLAAETGQTLGVLFHHRESKDSPSSLRLRIKASEDFSGQINQHRSEVQIRKARGSHGQRSVLLNLYRDV